MGRIPEGTAAEGNYLSPSLKSYLWPHHKKMARLVVAGVQPGELATISGFSAGQISRILGSPLFQTEVARLAESAEEQAIDIHKDLQMMSTRAIENLNEDLNLEVGDDIALRKVRQEVSKDILDRAGHTKKEKPTFGSLHLHKTEVGAVIAMTTKELLEDVMDLVVEEA